MLNSKALLKVLVQLECKRWVL